MGGGGGPNVFLRGHSKKYKKIAEYGRTLLASNGKIHAQMLKIIRETEPKA